MADWVGISVKYPQLLKPALANGDDVARQDLKHLGLAFGHSLGIEFENLFVAPVAAPDDDVSAISNPRETARHADGFEEIERLTALVGKPVP